MGSRSEVKGAAVFRSRHRICGGGFTGAQPWHVHVVAAAACVVPCLLDLAAPLGRIHVPLAHEAAVFGSCRSLVCRLRCASPSLQRRLRWHAFSCLTGLRPCHGSAWLPRLRTVSAPVRRGAVADARQGLA